MRSWLKEAREQRSLTQETVAENAGISRSYYTSIESGMKTPSVEVAKSIAETLGFNWTLFFDEQCSRKEQDRVCKNGNSARDAESA
ncbi:MAG: transcriptional regulator [Thermobacillus sp.]|uniref:helix-turn-helix transcriptional regulator n=1 Tax=Thermobacillus sp. TaxID=2108467 RepID=UPI000E3667BB|nr:helix-turn-helix transcriptional regulator [Thermobacillus sp.]REK54752.1 MAG: transcriptional regulator [Thermobacillus sp.]